MQELIQLTLSKEGALLLFLRYRIGFSTSIIYRMGMMGIESPTVTHVASKSLKFQFDKLNKVEPETSPDDTIALEKKLLLLLQQSDPEHYENFVNLSIF